MLRGTIIAPVVSVDHSNQDAAMVVIELGGQPVIQVRLRDWNTHGFQHRIKSNSTGVPRITVDAPSGGEFTIENGGNVGIGVTDCRVQPSM